ncbi:MAG TPA: helix-turn-helix transcriptional regulator [Acidimicrobiia bacterium]|jgi:DNA-binding CsgD family transcriptional regulator|nr:helix-turn-helix transcriptional regulator [Acidimicrobiia bacterium]
MKTPVHTPDGTSTPLLAGARSTSRLFDQVSASRRSVSLYDISSPSIVAVSEPARGQLGLNDIELADFDIVDNAQDPASVQRLLQLIGDGQLEAWTTRTWLRTTSGGGYWGYSKGRALDIGSHRFGLVFYPSPIAGTPTGHSSDSAGGAIRPLASSGEAPLPDPVRNAAPNDQPFVRPRDDFEAVALWSEALEPSERVVQLEGHLRRIAHEVEAAGLAPLSSLSVPGLPGYENLSARECEIVARMLRGDRVSTIARDLFLSASTIRNHLSRIYRKIGVHSQAELIEMMHHPSE